MSQQSVNAIKVLGVDAINKAKSGHPGVVMGAAPMAYSLFAKHLRVNPKKTDWINRDRFVLSAGHGSMLLYSLLHLSGFEDVSLEEVKNFRQWGSKTPGHPEFGHTKGVDATTGPLGQGISTAVGMALAERYLAAKYNKEGYELFDHYTYVICGDGDIMAREHIHIEKIPDFILMPNAGVRGIMWQEIEGKVRTTPGRMFISILHMEDLQNTIIRMTGEFRWELCKRVQGARWNDVTDPSLTSLYCDYVQFYRKNNNLSPDMKEKIKLSLQRCRNSFREMFVQDYMAYILYEGSGSPRLNKVARQILFEFCPLDAEGIERLSKNPTYSELIKQRQFKIEQKLQRYEGLERKLLKETGSIPLSLKKEIDFVKS